MYYAKKRELRDRVAFFKMHSMGMLEERSDLLLHEMLPGNVIEQLNERVFEKGDRGVQKLRAKWVSNGIVLWAQILSKILR